MGLVDNAVELMYGLGALFLGALPFITMMALTIACIKYVIG